MREPSASRSVAAVASLVKSTVRRAGFGNAASRAAALQIGGVDAAVAIEIFAGAGRLLPRDVTRDADRRRRCRAGPGARSRSSR